MDDTTQKAIANREKLSAWHALATFSAENVKEEFVVLGGNEAKFSLQLSGVCIERDDPHDAALELARCLGLVPRPEGWLPTPIAQVVEMGTNEIRPDGTQSISHWPSDNLQTTPVPGNAFKVIHSPGADVSEIVEALTELSKPVEG